MPTVKTVYALVAVCSVVMAGVQATDASTIGVETSVVALARDAAAPAASAQPADLRPR